MPQSEAQVTVVSGDTIRLNSDRFHLAPIGFESEQLLCEMRDQNNWAIPGSTGVPGKCPSKYTMRFGTNRVSVVSLSLRHSIPVTSGNRWARTGSNSASSIVVDDLPWSFVGSSSTKRHLRGIVTRSNRAARACRNFCM